MILKRGVVFCIAFLLLFGFYVRNVDATLGLTPALVEINFQPSYNFSVNFGALGAAPDQKLKVYAKGDFAEYVHFDKTEMTGAGGFTAYVNLPSQADKPGKNRLYIRVEEVNDNSGGVGTRIVIGALIAIYVPYPGKYAEISLAAKDVNEGESVPVTLEASNLGKEDIFVNPVLEIYNYDNTTIDSMNLGLREIKTQTKEKFETQINTKNYKPGVYSVFASVNYGGSEIVKANSTFRIGTLSVAVVNWTSMFKKGKINKFDIEIESLWNSKINSIYASVNVSREGKMLDYFKTSPSTLEMWQKSTISGYLNAESADAGSYDANITLYYEDKTSSREVEIVVYKEKNLTIIILVFAVIVVVISAGIFFILRWKKKHGKTEGKTKKK